MYIYTQELSCDSIYLHSPPYPSSAVDVGAPHMQLMLFVWHSFSPETRRVLLTQCAHSVVAVAKANEYAVYARLHPFLAVVCMYMSFTLLLVYMCMCVHAWLCVYCLSGLPFFLPTFE